MVTMLFKRRRSGKETGPADTQAHDDLRVAGELDGWAADPDDVAEEAALAAEPDHDEAGGDGGGWADLLGPTPAGLRRSSLWDWVGWYEARETDPLITSTDQAAALVPALMRTHEPFAGWPLGVDTSTGQYHASDPFILYDITRTLSAAIVGDVGVGKSTLAKTQYGLAQIAAGRQVAVFDRKENEDQLSEYARMAALVEASRKKVAYLRFDRHGGARVNVLDPSIAKRGADENTTVGQDELLEMIAGVVRPETPLSPIERYLLLAAQRQARDVAAAQGRQADIRDVAAAMFTPHTDYLPDALQRSGYMTAEHMYRHGESVAFALETAITGSLSGLIDGPTADQHGDPIDLDADLIVVDTSTLVDGSPALMLVMAIMTTFLGSVWSMRQRQAMAIVEEGYSADLPAVSNVFRTQVKRGRGVGLGLVLVMHHFNDVSPDSPLAALYKEAGIIHLFGQRTQADADNATQILGVPELSEMVQGLEPYEHLLFEGGNRTSRPPRRISGVLTDTERWVTWTDDAIRGADASPPSPLPARPVQPNGPPHTNRHRRREPEPTNA
jgi:hypothetical protein